LLLHNSPNIVPGSGRTRALIEYPAAVKNKILRYAESRSYAAYMCQLPAAELSILADNDPQTKRLRRVVRRLKAAAAQEMVFGEDVEQLEAVVLDSLGRHKSVQYSDHAE